MKLPDSLAACADRLFQIREERTPLKRALDDLDAEAVAIREHLVNTLSKSDSLGAVGTKARATIKTKRVPTISDIDAFLSWAGAPGNEDALVKPRLSIDAVRSRIESGEAVPGIEMIDVPTVSVNKL